MPFPSVGLLVVLELGSCTTLLVSKYFFDPNSACTGEWDLVQVQSAGEQCIPSKCALDSQFGGSHLAECLPSFELGRMQIAQEFHTVGTNCTKEPSFVLIHDSKRCRNILGDFIRFECDGSLPSITRYASSNNCGELLCPNGCQLEPQSPVCDTTDRSGWQTQVKGCVQLAYKPSDITEDRVTSVADLRPQLHTLLSGQLWETDGGYAGSAPSLNSMGVSVQILLGLVSFILTLAALD
eukprot:gb/GEZN01014200.1/.p1 GENE.gb/GEZN01014200.1/~~gb/GEZN01014200.1/.p1  ORF type:complete len:238 (-),score=15.19 gb/GEZN01014200.1/:177-890(-)